MKMIKSIYLILAVLACSAICSGISGSELWISTYQYKYENAHGHWKVFEPHIYGGSGKFLIKYFDLPVGWDYYDSSFPSEYSNGLFIPKNAPSVRYQIGIQVYDLRFKNTLSKYLVLIPSSNSIAVFVRDEFDPYVNFQNKFDFKEKDIVKLPSWSKINELIFDGDITQLMNIVKRVIVSQNSCLQKEAFLQGILSRMEKFVAAGAYKISQIRDQIKQLTYAVKEDSAQLEYLLNIKYKNVNLKNLKWELDSTEDDLEFFIKRSEFIKNDIRMYLENIKQFTYKIKNLEEKEIPSLIIDIKVLKKEIFETEISLGSRYGSDKVWWEFQLKKLVTTLEKKQKMLKEAEDNINIFGLKVKWFDSKIKHLELQLDSQFNEILPLQKKVDNLRSQISALENQIYEIDALKRRIAKNEGYIQIKLQQIKRIQWSIQTIAKQIEGFRAVIGKANYECHYVQVQKYNNNAGYLSRNQFERYVEQVFDAKYVPQIKFSQNQYQVKDVDIYSPIWSDNYGPSYTYGKDLYEVQEDCEYSTRSVVESGYIVEVIGNTIWVNVNERKVELHLLSCTVVKIAKVGGGMMKKGDRIVWRGDSYNLNRGYKVSHCIIT